MGSVIKMCPLQSKVSPNTLNDQIGMHIKLGEGAFLFEVGKYFYWRTYENILETRS